MPEDRAVMHTRLLVNEVARRTHHRHGLTRYLVWVVLNELVAVIAEQLAAGKTGIPSTVPPAQRHSLTFGSSHFLW